MKIFLFLIALILLSVPCVGVSAIADGVSYPPPHQIIDTDHTRRISTQLALGLSQLHSSEGTLLSAFAIGAGGTYGLTRKWGVGLNLNEAFSTGSGFNPAYTQWGVYLSWAVTGSLISESRSVAVDKWNVVNADSPYSGGLKIDFALNQYLFTGTTQSAILSGPGVRVRYEFASDHNPYHYYVGLGVDQIGNGDISAMPLQIIGGVSLCL